MPQQITEEMLLYLIEFNDGIDSLDSFRNKRLKLNSISVAASILKDRAPSGLIAFEELMQADCILFLRHYFPMTTNYGGWYPRCLSYAERIGAADLFARGATDPGFDTLKKLFGIDNRIELMEGLDAAIAAGGSRIANFRIAYTLGRYLNYSELNRASGRKVKGP